MAVIAVELNYAANGDLLWLGNGIPNTDSAQNVTFEPDFDAFFSVEGKCVGFYLFDAARILFPQLILESPTVKFGNYREFLAWPLGSARIVVATATLDNSGVIA